VRSSTLALPQAVMSLAKHRRSSSLAAGLALLVILASAASGSISATSRRTTTSTTMAARELLLYLPSTSHLFARSLAPRQLRRAVRAPGVIQFADASGGTTGKISCINTGLTAKERILECRWSVKFRRRATFWGLALVRQYRPGPAYDVEMLWHKCRSVGGSSYCLSHPLHG
jgi:hypothetical protein